MKKKILITGGAGFIGYHLAKRLAAQGYAITLADNFFRGKRNADFEALIKKPNVRFIKTDLTKLKNWDKLGAGFDQVYHLVGINGTKLFYSIPHEVLRIGVSTTMNALEWFRTKNKKKNAKNFNLLKSSLSYLKIENMIIYWYGKCFWESSMSKLSSVQTPANSSWIDVCWSLLYHNLKFF